MFVSLTFLKELGHFIGYRIVDLSAYLFQPEVAGLGCGVASLTIFTYMLAIRDIKSNSGM